MSDQTNLAAILEKNEVAILTAWVQEQLTSNARQGVISEGELTEASRVFLSLSSRARSEATTTRISPAMHGNLSRSI
ncbi:RsbRD N-terminal domain-containing protein [Paraburkholderia sp. D15]|uniref:RsbRD N-terminal domain-containing protein n=1 Tax=Paraburkholderia sp. D15 TaxID=2880218 RepID=UPI0032B04C52